MLVLNSPLWSAALLLLPLLWWLPEISVTAGAHFSAMAPTPTQILPEPFVILLMGVVLLVAASGFRFILAKKQDAK